MGTVSRVHTFSSGAILTAAQLNNEFDNLLTSSAINGGLDATNLGVTAGQATASKALVVDSSRNLADGTAGNRINNLALSGTFESTGGITATAGITSGGNIVSDTDSTDDLGTTSVRWANLYADSIGDSGQALAVKATTLSFDAASTIDTSGNNNLTLDAGTATLTLDANTIESDASTLSFDAAATIDTSGNNNLSLDAGTATLTLDAGTIESDAGTLSFDAAASIDTSGNNALAINTGSANLNVTAATLALTGAQTISSTLGVTGLITASGGVSGTTGTFSGDVAVDTDTLFVDVSEGRVGVNAGTTPGAALDVAHTGTSAAFRVYNSQATDPYGILIDNTGANLSDSNYVADFRVGGYSILKLNNSGQMAFAPNSYGGASAGNLTVKKGSINDHSIRLEAGGTTSTYLEYRGYLGHSWYVDSTRKATLNATGLGVGVDSPSAPLAVASKASSYEGMELVTPSGDGSGVFQFGVHDSGGSAGRGIEFRRGGSDGFDTLSLSIDNNAHLGIRVAPNSGWATANATLQVGAQGGIWSPVTADTTTAMSLSHNGYFNGSAWVYIHTGAYAAQYYQYQGGHYFRTAASGTAGGTISYSNVLTMLNDGKIGVNSASPTSTFYVKNDTANSYAIEVDASDGSNMFGVWETSAGNGEVYVRDASGTAKVWLTSSGNSYFTGGAVGIGTTPEHTLHVKNTADDAVIEVETSATNGNPAFRLKNDAQEWQWQLRGAESDSLVAWDVTAVAGRLYIDTSGNVLIGYASSQGSYKLQVNSQIFATNATIATSDGRYKEDVQTLSDATELVSRLNPVQFKWKAHEIHNLNVGKTDVGFIAQEVQAVLSDTDYSDSVVVSNKTDDEEYLGLGETKLIPLLTAALQEAITKIETLETKVSALEAA